MRVPPVLAIVLLLSLVIAVGLGETPLTLSQYGQGLTRPNSPAAEILWTIRAPRAVSAALVGAALGMAGAVMQGLLRNPLADPGVLGVSALSAMTASLTIAAGFATIPGAVELAALAGALAAGVLVVGLAARLRTPETLILFGVALSAAGGALTALVFNLSASPVATAEVLNWLMGSVANRDWRDIAAAAVPAVLGGALCARAAVGLRMLTLGEEAAALSGLPMARLRMFAVAAGGVADRRGGSDRRSDRLCRPGRAAPGPPRCRRRSGPRAGAVRPGRRDSPGRRRSRRAAGSHRGRAEAGCGDRSDRRAGVRARGLARGAELARVTPPLELIDAEVNVAGRRVLRAVSLEVLPGEVLGVVGANGSGKTTLLRAALGLTPLRRGEARLAGRAVSGLSDAERAARAGYLPQERRVGWNMPAAAIAALGAIHLSPAQASQRAAEALELVGLAHLAGRGVLDMSGGERARVLVARLLVTGAPLLVADEPTAGLDPEAQFRIMQILVDRTAAGAAIVVTLHDLTLAARMCDRIAVLADGGLVALGSPAVALSSHTLQAAFGLDGELTATAAGVVVAVCPTLTSGARR